ncbi:MAG: XdhC family protein [Acidimicrobiales bacterium]
MTPEVLALAADLARRREPFVLATVVWRRGQSSGKPGAAAVILPDGTVQGWLGGACAEPTVVREASLALANGRSCLLLMGPTEERLIPDGAKSVPMACANEGALEVYLEPMLPPPHVVVIGRSPAVSTLAALAHGLGWAATIVDVGSAGFDHPEGVAFAATLDLSTVEGFDDSTCVVVATQGHYDEAALEVALATDAAYVGLVASKARAAEVFDFLRDRGVSDQALARVRAPAGLDLGRVDHQEIAVAVLAELVKERASGGLVGPTAAAASAVVPPGEAIDPVCGMTVDRVRGLHRVDHEGTTHHFCAAACLQQFLADPARYLD